MRPIDLVPTEEGGDGEAKEVREVLEKAAGKKHKGGKGAAASAAATAAAKKHLAAKKPSGADDGDEPFEKRFAKLPREEQLRKVKCFLCLHPDSRPPHTPHMFTPPIHSRRLKPTPAWRRLPGRRCRS